jgi:Zn-dependent protease with chaperone function
MEAVLAAAARRRHGQGVGLVAALGILALVFLFLQPLSAALSRQGELAADREELRLTGDRDAFVRVRLALARINLADPDPPGWRRYLASHPPLAERLALALPRSAQRATHWLPRSPGLPPSGNPRRHSAP